MCVCVCHASKYLDNVIINYFVLIARVRRDKHNKKKTLGEHPWNIVLFLEIGPCPPSLFWLVYIISNGTICYPCLRVASDLFIVYYLIYLTVFVITFYYY